MKDSERLTKAADLLAKGEWGRGSPDKRGSESLCLLQALSSVTAPRYLNEFGWSFVQVPPALEKLCRARIVVVTGLEREAVETHPHTGPCWMFNDKFAKSKDEVIAILREAAFLTSLMEPPVPQFVEEEDARQDAERIELDPMIREVFDEEEDDAMVQMCLNTRSK